MRSSVRTRAGARALLAAACALSLAAAGALNAPVRASAPRPTGAASRVWLRPAVVVKPIPFGRRRRREMAAYSKRHYGTRAWRLIEPEVIVEHFTDGSSFEGAWATFASNAPHLGELPGVCAHFVIDTDGTIYRLVPLGTRCRHTIGLNWTAIGIEDVATSDAQVLHDRAQLRASLRLTLWLMQRFGIELRNVIGHAESLTSPYHHELYPSWRCMTHSDWSHADMQVYRRRLRRMARRNGVPIGPPPEPVDPGC